MLDDLELDRLFHECGYVKHGRFQYKFNSSVENIHKYVEMERSVRDKSRMPGRVCIGNTNLSAECGKIWLLYSEETAVVSENNFYTLSQIFLNIDRKRNYTQTGALLVSDPANVSAFLDELITPLLRPIDSIEKLYDVTVRGDDTPFNWTVGIPGIRATHALILGKNLDKSFSDVVSQLNVRRQILKQWSSTRDVDNFFDFVWRNTAYVRF